MDESVPQASRGEKPTPNDQQESSYIGVGEEWHSAPVERPHPLAPPSTVSPQTSEPAGPAAKSPRHAMVTEHRHGQGHVQGLARSVQTRTIDSSVVLSFRVDQYDEAGNRAQPVGVELWHHRAGQVSDGEEVEVTGRWKGGTLRAQRIVNLTTGAQVKGVPRKVRAIVITVILVLFLGWAGFLIYLGVTQS